MRWIFLFVTTMIVGVIIKGSNLINDLDNDIFMMYRNNFNDYLYVNDEYMICVDTDKLEKKLQKYGDVTFASDDLHFIVKLRLYGEKEYRFYLEKNYVN